MMLVYHGSYCEVATPNLSFSRRDLDFGQGFYVTPLQDQAGRWALRSLRRGGKAVLNIYRFDIDAVTGGGFHCKDFPEYNEEWLDFVIANRRGESLQQFDIVQGGVANDKVFNTIELYFDNLIDKAEAIKRLKFEAPNHQLCIRKQEIIDKYLFFASSEEVRGGS